MLKEDLNKGTIKDLKRELLALLSHETRTPLLRIFGNLNMLEDKMEEKEEDDPDIDRYIAGIRQGAERILSTHNEMLLIAQLKSNTYKMNFKEVDLNTDILLQVVKKLKAKASEKGLNLSYENLNEGVTEIEADRDTIREIMEHLVDNAIKYTDKGDVKITLSSFKDIVKIEIEDSGVGISGDYKKCVYELFSQESSGYDRNYEGNGLGLAVVKECVTLNNGEISFKSAKDQGTKFTVKFNRKK